VEEDDRSAVALELESASLEAAEPEPVLEEDTHRPGRPS
jgi:hypothetical protein